MQDICTKSLGNGTVLIEEHQERAPRKHPIRYYLTDKFNADKFIKSKQNEENTNIFQNISAAALSVISGVYIGAKIKSNTATKIIGGTSSAGGIYSGVHKLNKIVNEQDQLNSEKRFKIEEITNDTERVEETLKNVEPEPEQTEAGSV